MKVYVLTKYDYDWSSVCGVLTDKSLAEQWVKEQGESDPSRSHSYMFDEHTLGELDNE